MIAGCRYRIHGRQELRALGASPQIVPPISTKPSVNVPLTMRFRGRHGPCYAMDGMSLLTQLLAGRNARVVRQAVAGLAALALVGVSVGAACQCPMKVTPSHDSACCRSAVGVPTVVVQANTCGSVCMRAQTETPVGETLAVPDTAPPSVPLVFVVAVHHAFASTPARAALVHTPPLILSSSRPILRI